VAAVDPVVIRAGGRGDAAALAAFGAASFRSTYERDVPAEALDGFVSATFGDAIQAAELADPACRFLLAEVDGGLAGYLLLRDGTPPPGVPGDHPLLLDRFYVAPAAQGRGIGGALLRRAIDEAQDDGHDLLWLSVWERNARAIAVYQRWGFVPVGEIAFDLAGVRHTDQLLALPCPVRGPAEGPGSARRAT
jgi:diamine N-acetyltransferase